MKRCKRAREVLLPPCKRKDSDEQINRGGQIKKTVLLTSECWNHAFLVRPKPSVFYHEGYDSVKIQVRHDIALESAQHRKNFTLATFGNLFTAFKVFTHHKSRKFSKVYSMASLYTVILRQMVISLRLLFEVYLLLMTISYT